MLQQLQRVGTQPIFDDLASFDAKEVHTCILDLLPNCGRRSSWHTTLIRSAKEPATSNQVIISEGANRGGKAVVGKGSDGPADPLLESIGTTYLTGAIADGSEMRDEIRCDNRISEGQIAIP